MTEETPLSLNMGYFSGEFEAMVKATKLANDRESIEQLHRAIEKVTCAERARSVLRFLSSSGKIDAPGSTDPQAQSVPACFYQLKKWAVQCIANTLRSTVKSQFAGSHAFVTPQDCEKRVLEVATGKLELEPFKRLAQSVGTAGKLETVPGSSDELNSAWQLLRLVLKGWLTFLGWDQSGLTAIDRHLLLSGKQGGIAVAEMEHFVKLVVTDWEDAVHQFRHSMTDQAPDLGQIVARQNAFLLGEAAHAHAMRRFEAIMESKLAKDAGNRSYAQATASPKGKSTSNKRARQSGASSSSAQAPKTAASGGGNGSGSKQKAPADRVRNLSMQKDRTGYADRDRLSVDELKELYDEFNQTFPGYCRAYNIKGCARDEKECKHKHSVPKEFQAWALRKGHTFNYDP